MLATSVVSFGGMAETRTPDSGRPAYANFANTSSFDLSPVIQRGDAVLLAWLPGQGVAPSLNQFVPRYTRKDALLRVLVHVSSPDPHE
jgi:hypothetical protein